MLCVGSGLAAAQVFEQRIFQDPGNEQRYRDLISELRCLVCQNQNLADSNAPLAADLRSVVYDMIREGKTDNEILAFMIERYGDFVLYRPPFAGRTLLLWVGPFALLAIALWVLARQVRKRAPGAAGSGRLSDAERERLRAMLDDSGGEADRGRRD